MPELDPDLEAAQEHLLALRARSAGEPVPVPIWQQELDKMIRQVKIIGWVMLPVIVIAAGVEARNGLWVFAITLSASAGYMGFALGLLTARTIRRRW